MIEKNKKILITGANGFIGSNILEKLVTLGYVNISIIIRQNSNTHRIDNILKNVNIYFGDLTNKDDIEIIISKIKPDIIYHTAAIGTSGGKDLSDFDTIYNSNFLGTKNLLDACKKNGFDFFINSGSSSEYGESLTPMREEQLCKPNNDYGLAKLYATNYCKYIGEKFDLPIYTFRIFSAYGKGEDERRLFPTLIKSYKNGIPPNLSKPNSVRDFIYIDDIIDYYLNIDKIKNNSNVLYGSIFNLGSGIQHSVKDIVDIIKEKLNSDINPNYGEVKSYQNEPTCWIADMNKTDKVFQKKRLSLGEGILRLIH